MCNFFLQKYLESNIIFINFIVRMLKLKVTEKKILLRGEPDEK